MLESLIRNLWIERSSHNLRHSFVDELNRGELTNRFVGVKNKDSSFSSIEHFLKLFAIIKFSLINCHPHSLGRWFNEHFLHKVALTQRNYNWIIWPQFQVGKWCPKCLTLWEKCTRGKGGQGRGAEGQDGGVWWGASGGEQQGWLWGWEWCFWEFENMNKHYGLVFLFIKYKINFISVSLTKNIFTIIKIKNKITVHLHVSIYG